MEKNQKLISSQIRKKNCHLRKISDKVWQKLISVPSQLMFHEANIGEVAPLDPEHLL
jgi:hypothetical protein